MVKLPSLPKFGKKKRGADDEDEDAFDFGLELDGFEEDHDDEDAPPLFGANAATEQGGATDPEDIDFIDDLADGDMGGEDDYGLSDDQDDMDLDSFGFGGDRDEGGGSGGPLAKIKALFKRDSDPFADDDDPHFRDSDEDDNRNLVHIFAAVLMAGGLIAGYLMVTGGGEDEETASEGQVAVNMPLPAPTDAPREGLMTPPGQDSATGAEGDTSRSLERRPWLSDSAPEAPQGEGMAGEGMAGERSPGESAAGEMPAQGAPAEGGSPEAPEAGRTSPNLPESTVAEPAAPQDSEGTGGEAASTEAAQGAFQRPAAQLLPSAPVTEPPSTPVFPVEDGFRPGRMPRYSDLPAPNSFGATPLSDAPLTDLLRATESGLLPVIAEDGRMAWRTYARPFSGDPTLPRVAIIVDGLGMRDRATQSAIAQTPPDVTLAFSPYAENLAVWMGQARQAGHETLLELPVEPLGFPSMDPGPLALLSIIAELENRKRLDAVLGRAGGYVGLLASASGRFTDTPQSMRPVLQSLKTRGLLYVHRGDAAAVNANNDTVPPVNAVTVDLDQDPFQRAIDTRLTFLEEEARAQGFAIGVIGATPVALYRLTRWLGTLEAKGIALAPVSAVMLTGER